jgi:glutamyl-tRNA synthetase
VRQASPFLTELVEFEPEAVTKQWRDAAATAELLQATHDCLAELPDWTPATMEEALRALAEARGISGGKIFQPLRVALVGGTVSPGIFEVLEYVGRERSLARLDAAVRFLQG